MEGELYPKEIHILLSDFILNSGIILMAILKTSWMQAFHLLHD